MCTDPYTGGSIASAEGLVQVKDIVISGLCESFVRNGMGEDAAFGDRPIALSYAPNLPLLESDPRWYGYWSLNMCQTVSSALDSKWE